VGHVCRAFGTYTSLPLFLIKFGNSYYTIITPFVNRGIIDP